MQAVESRQWWMITFGSSEIQSCAAGLTCGRAIHSATPAGFTTILQQQDPLALAKLLL